MGDLYLDRPLDVKLPKLRIWSQVKANSGDRKAVWQASIS